MFNKICELCEDWTVDHKCENKDTCPVYGLYKLAINKKTEKYGECNVKPAVRSNLVS